LDLIIDGRQNFFNSGILFKKWHFLTIGKILNKGKKASLEEPKPLKNRRYLWIFGNKTSKKAFVGQKKRNFGRIIWGLDKRSPLFKKGPRGQKKPSKGGKKRDYMGPYKGLSPKCPGVSNKGRKKKPPPRGGGPPNNKGGGLL